MIDIPNTISKSFDIIFSKLREIGYPTGFRRSAGVPRVTVENAMASYGLVAPPGLIDLYAYSDGTDDPTDANLGDVYIFPGYHWLKFQEACQYYEYLVSTEFWHEEWFPIFANGGGDYYIVVSDIKSPFYEEVSRVLRDSEEFVAEYRNIETFTLLNAKCYEAGVYFMENGVLKDDQDFRRELAKNIQPGFDPHVIGKAYF